MSVIQHGGSRYADLDFNAYAMLQPPASYRTNRTSLTQYGANSSEPGYQEGGAGLGQLPAQGRQQHQHTPNTPGARRNRKQKNANLLAGAHNKSAFAQLQTDEAALQQRKSNISRFGATWLRPPGLSKTYQAMMDEAAEREEAEVQARREAAAAEEQRAAREAQFAANAAAAGQRTGGRLRRAAGDVGDDGAMDIDAEGDDLGDLEVEDEERDLDDDVPEADDVEFDESDEEEHELHHDDHDTNDDASLVDDLDAGGGLLEETTSEDFAPAGSVASGGPDGSLDHDNDHDNQDEDDVFGLERDLDNSIPSAGSYQHTDTDVEDSSSLDIGLDGRDTPNVHLSSDMNPLFPPASSQSLPPTQSRAQALMQTPPLPAPTATPAIGGTLASRVPVANALNPPQILDGATGQFVHSIEGTADFLPVGVDPAAVEGGRNSLRLDMLDPDVSFDGSSFLLSSPSAVAQRMRSRGDNENVSRQR